MVVKKKTAVVLYGGSISCCTTGKILWIAKGCHYDKANPGARERLNHTYRPDDYEIIPNDHLPTPSWWAK